uniref:FBA_2 domain-containing protein n=1 Tax=Steinernema glaseri TaxID=37863 RepID=A0A1I7Z090_9BILA
MWGKVGSLTSKKIHTFHIVGDEKTKRLYAAAQPFCYEQYDDAVLLDSVDPKFLANFHIEGSAVWKNIDLSRTWREISLDEVQRLVRCISRRWEERHPLSYDYRSSNCLWIDQSTNDKLLPMRLPVKSAFFLAQGATEYVEQFFENHLGPLYELCCITVGLKQSTVDAMIDKFVPVDGGSFYMQQELTREQIERLVLKCEMAEKKVKIQMLSQDSTYCTKCSDVLQLFDFNKHYTKREFIGGNLIAVRGGSKLEVTVRFKFVGSFEWQWDEVKYQAKSGKKVLS